MITQKTDWKKILISFISATNQYFNYSFFPLASLVLSQEFLPSEQEDSSNLLAVFKIIAISVVARPLGSVIFGVIGDMYGGRYAVLIAGIASSFSLILIGFLPSFEDIGYISIVFLILLRMLYLSSFAGEIDAIRIYVSEMVSPKRQVFTNGIITSLTQVGALISALLVYFSYIDLVNWRHCFIIGGLVGFLVYILRRFVNRKNEKTEIEIKQIFPITIKQILKGNFKIIFTSIILFGFYGSLYNFYIIFFPSFIKIYFVDYFNKYLVIKLIILYFFSSIFWGYIADYLTCFLTSIICAVVTIFNLFCFYIILSNNMADYIIIFLCLGVFFAAGYSVSIQIFVKNSINKAIQYRIFSFSHSMGSMLISTVTPFISLKLVLFFDNIGYSCLYLLTISIIATAILIYRQQENK